MDVVDKHESNDSGTVQSGPTFESPLVIGVDFGTTYTGIAFTQTAAAERDTSRDTKKTKHKYGRGKEEYHVPNLFTNLNSLLTAPPYVHWATFVNAQSGNDWNAEQVVCRKRHKRPLQWFPNITPYVSSTDLWASGCNIHISNPFPDGTYGYREAWYDNDRIWIGMDAPQKTIRHFITADIQLHTSDWLEIVRGIATGLTKAQGCVHGDLKPSNGMNSLYTR